jgi:hypothetical protein
MPAQGILESIDQLIAGFVPALTQMGDLLGQFVTISVNGTNQTMPLSTAALTGFISPWVDQLGPICTAIAQFLNAL